MAVGALPDPTGLSVPFGLDVDPTGFDQGAGLLDKLSKKLGGIHGFDIDVNPAKAVKAMMSVYDVVDKIQQRWSEFAAQAQGFPELGLSGADVATMRKNVDTPSSVLATSGITSDQLIGVMRTWAQMAQAAILEGKDEYSDFALGAKYFNFDATYIKDAITNGKTDAEILTDVLDAVQAAISDALKLPAAQKAKVLNEIVGKASLIGLPQELTSAIIKLVSMMQTDPNVNETKISSMINKRYAADIANTPGTTADISTSHAFARAEQKRAEEGAKESKELELAERLESVSHDIETAKRLASDLPIQFVSWLMGDYGTASTNRSAQLSALFKNKTPQELMFRDWITYFTTTGAPDIKTRESAQNKATYKQWFADRDVSASVFSDRASKDVSWLAKAAREDVGFVRENTGQIGLNSANDVAIRRAAELYMKVQHGSVTAGDLADYLIPQLMVTAGEESVDALRDVFFGMAGFLKFGNANYSDKEISDIAGELYKVYSVGSEDTHEDDFQWNNLLNYFESAGSALPQADVQRIVAALVPIAEQALRGSGMFKDFHHPGPFTKDRDTKLIVEFHGQHGSSTINIEKGAINSMDATKLLNDANNNAKR